MIDDPPESSAVPARGKPFGTGSISMALYLDPTDGARAGIEAMLREAKLAERVGFDGVTTGEHHASNYLLPSPMLVASFFLHELTTAWAAPYPVLLPFYSPVALAEQIAWLELRFPGRVALGAAAGYDPVDFEIMGVDKSGLAGIMDEKLVELAALLRGEHATPAAADLAIQAQLADPVPLLVGIGSRRAASRAVALYAGAMLPSSSPLTKLADWSELYRAAGGLGPIVFHRRVWIGDDPVTDRSVLQAHELADINDRGGWGSAHEYRLAGAAEDVIGELLRQASLVGATSISLRIDDRGISRSQIASQIELLGDLLPKIRTGFATSVRS